MGKVVADYMKHGRPTQIAEETWLDMLLVKHTIVAIEEMKKEGDSISTMFDGELSSAYVGGDYDNT